VQQPAKLRLSVQYAVRTRGVPSREQLRRWARAALERDASLTLRLVGKAEAQALNRNFRGKNRATNVLSFMMHEPPLEGDIALCAPVIAREAHEQGKRLAAHYAHLVVHGVLHLQGYDHETSRAALDMEQREKRILNRLGFSDPYDIGKQSEETPDVQERSRFGSRR
jgi:probable rRNA maturation factor